MEGKMHDSMNYSKDPIDAKKMRDDVDREQREREEREKSFFSKSLDEIPHNGDTPDQLFNH